jgi:hypothetical protein
MKFQNNLFSLSLNENTLSKEGWVNGKFKYNGAPYGEILGNL